MISTSFRSATTCFWLVSSGISPDNYSISRNIHIEVRLIFEPIIAVIKVGLNKFVDEQLENAWIHL